MHNEKTFKCRRKACGDVMETNDSWQETEYLMSTEANRAALEKSIGSLNAGNFGKVFTPEEWEAFEKNNG